MQKKCLELSTLTECEVAMIIIYKGKLYQYASSDMDQLMLRYSEGTAEPQESRTNVDVGESRVRTYSMVSN